MKLCSVMIAMVVLNGAARADSASQSDWSGGPGVMGPVTDWTTCFYQSSGVTYSIPGMLTISDLCIVIDDQFDGAHSVHARDIDGDGYVDVIGAAYDDNQVAWYENSDTAPGMYWVKHIVDADFAYTWSAYAEDINGDGNVDIVGAAHDDDLVSWWERQESCDETWVEHVIDASFDGACAVYCEDLDDDSDMDVIAAARSGDTVAWWENSDGSGEAWIEHVIEYGFAGARSVYADDIDADGDLDVIGAAVIGNLVTWWENSDGSGEAWIEHPVAYSLDGACAVHSQDVDGDGDRDILAAAVHADLIAWWENLDGSGGSWSMHTIKSGFDGAHSVLSEDIDGDGDNDVVGTAEIADEVVWWENVDGSGLSWIEHLVADDFDGAEWAWLADFDHDGDTDVVAAAEYANEIAWWSLLTEQAEGYLESSVLDLQDDPDWGIIYWSGTQPSGSTLAFQVRASEFPEDMGMWSDTLPSPCSLDGVLPDEASYLQYRAILIGSASGNPSLTEVTVTWNPLGIEGEEPYELALLPFSPNPVSGAPTVRFSLPGAQPVGFEVFDIAGRITQVIPAQLFESGLGELQLSQLPPGIYFCRMNAGGLTATQSFVVVE